MIISASRRTDIPAFYGEWLIRRLREGFVIVPNPFNPSHLTLQSLFPEDVEAIVFWTKNPQPFLSYLPEIDRLGFRNRYFFLFTLNPYQDTVFEPNLPPLTERIHTLYHLADLIGRERIVWRYDPIIFSKGKHPMDSVYHRRVFHQLLKEIHPSVNKVIVSFLDFYRKNRWYFRIMKQKGIVDVVEPSQDDIADLSEFMVDLTAQYGIDVYGCSEKKEYFDIMNYKGIKAGRCIHAGDLEKILPKGKLPKALHKKDPGQRETCGCTISKDIGVYHTCFYQCGYCYATDPHRVIRLNHLDNPSLYPKLDQNTVSRLLEKWRFR